MTSRSPLTSFVLSARSPAALAAANAGLASWLADRPEASLASVASTLQTGRSQHAHRQAISARSVQDARAGLLDPKRVVSGIHDGSARHPVFMFSGQGSQYADMGRELYITWPVFRREVDRCAELLAPRLGHDLRAAIFSREREFEGVDRHRDRAASTIHRGVRVGTSADDARARPGRHHRPQHRRVRVRLPGGRIFLRTPSRSSRSAGA